MNLETARNSLDDTPDVSPAVTIARMRSELAAMTEDNDKNLLAYQWINRLLDIAYKDASQLAQQRDAARTEAETLAKALDTLRQAYEGRMADTENADWHAEYNQAVSALAAHREAK